MKMTMMVLMLMATAAAAQTPPSSYRLHQSIDALFTQLETGQTGNLILIGDSISFRGESYHGVLQENFWRDYGVGGDGYRGCSNGTGSPQMFYSTHPLTAGQWVQPVRRTIVSGTRTVDSAGIPWDGGLTSPDGIVSELADGGEYWVDMYGPEVVVHLVRGPDSASVKIAVDGQTVNMIDSQPSELTHMPVLVNVGDAGVHEVRVTNVDNAGTALVNGFEGRSGSGFRMHRMSRGGAGPDDFLLSTNQVVFDQMSSTEPDLIMVMLDPTKAGNEIYRQEIESYLDFLEPMGAPIILMSHHPFTPTREAHALILYEIAAERAHGFIDLFHTWSGYAEMDAMGFMMDNVHFTFAGGDWFGNYIYDLMQHARDCPADTTGDGVLDNGDIGAFVDLFMAFDWAADFNNDGVIDNGDLGAFIDAFLAGCAG